MRSLEVGLEGRGYAIHVGHGILGELGRHCRRLELGRRVAVLCDQTLRSRYLEPVCASLRQAEFEVLEVVFEGGEGAKNLRTLDRLAGHLIAAELDRSAWIAALGGGVVGDLAGFLAASFLRGVDFVQVPTTLLAQVDASIGGKTAVNHRLGKNLIGAFHQPRMVYIDAATLQSLPRLEWAAGLAEVVKHALIRDVELFEFLEAHMGELSAGQLGAGQLEWLIARNVRIKAAVVEADEKESGLRAILNYGHTIGQAIEAATAYEKYRHGEAVVLGMIGAGEMALRRGLWVEEDRRRQDALLRRVGVPAGLAQVPAERIVERTGVDKKRVEGRRRLVLGRRIGEVEIVDDIDEAEVRAAVEYVQREYH